MDVCLHEWHRVHHYGDHTGGNRFLHYCPTGFDMCANCLEWRDTPETDAPCRKWAAA